MDDDHNSREKFILVSDAFYKFEILISQIFPNYSPHMGKFLEQLPTDVCVCMLYVQ